MSSSDKSGEIPHDHQLALVTMQRQLAQYEESLARLSQQQVAPEDDDDIIDLRELWNMLVRRRWTIAITMLVILVVAGIATALMTPIYRATTVVQIELDSGNVLQFEDVTREESGSTSKDFYQTQYELLQSRALASRVVDRLGLQPEAPAEPGLIGSILALFSSAESDTQAEDALPPDVVSAFKSSLSIEPVRNSRLVKIHYDSPNARQAALVANAVSDAYVEMNLERRFEASTYAKSFLEDRIKQVRADLEDSEARFVRYAQERGIVDQEDKLGILMGKLRAMNAALVEVEAERIEAESTYQEMLDSSIEGLAEALNSRVIEQLKTRRAQLQSDYQQNLQIYKEGYPLMVQLRDQLTQLNADIDKEINNIREGIQLRYQAKLREEAKLMESIELTKIEILELNQGSTDFQSLKREVDTNRELYDGLLQRMKEVGVAAGIANNNISVVDAAEIPRGPHKPNIPLNMALALVLGLFAGCGLALLFEMLDDTIKSGSDYEKILGKPVLGIIPRLKTSEDLGPAQVALQGYLEPTSAISEAHRSMRTALLFSSSEGAPKVLHFTSMAPAEGKTTTAVNTAVAFAATGSKVLLIDGDLRNPSLHKIFNKPNDNGLSNYLTGDAQPGRVTQQSGIDNLFLMTSGPVPPNPAELLHGARMMDLTRLAAQRFDYVVLDGPPLLGLSDALQLADVASATLLVAAAHSTRRGNLEEGLKRLRQTRGKVLGGVLTKFDLEKSSYGYGYGYDYAYSYSYGTGAQDTDDEANDAGGFAGVVADDAPDVDHFANDNKA